jgi:hypothetical protein
MDEADSPTSPGAPETEASLRQEVRSLRRTSTILLAATVCIGAALTVYMYGQVRMLSRQISEGKRMVNDFQSNSAPRIEWFVGNLQAFSKTNPDFLPILAKYQLLPGTSAPPGKATPPPVAPAPKKK